MKLRWLTVIGCLFLAACGETESTSENPRSPSDLFAEIEETYDDQYAEFLTVYNKAADPEEKKTILEEKLPNAKDFANDFFQLAEDFPGDDAAVDSLIWVASNVRGEKDIAERAYSSLIDNLSLIHI